MVENMASKPARIVCSAKRIEGIMKETAIFILRIASVCVLFVFIFAVPFGYNMASNFL